MQGTQEARAIFYSIYTISRGTIKNGPSLDTPALSLPDLVIIIIFLNFVHELFLMDISNLPQGPC